MFYIIFLHLQTVVIRSPARSHNKISDTLRIQRCFVHTTGSYIECRRLNFFINGKLLFKKRTDFAEPQAKSCSSGPEYLDKEGRRAMIGGALSAFLLVGGLLAAAFAAVILIIGHLH